ncbi:hypothetical protein K450DRAFT_241266 [Umbelopsis ramanniana AG]|uniref:Uncharacterized protein n=1 Tax=Umbelopsis ramanniana AG TaxID=1314678 RepID=A0AAD5HEL9_UMBRA|nr:uncharacterized protein K450DRAFT_241266 [Umbelopsis ramanniana AG]KAI8579736.1 hypothetical protein K450DRAFT_241266 [Umbelopsis ramanniana AG]
MSHSWATGLPRTSLTPPPGSQLDDEDQSSDAGNLSSEPTHTTPDVFQEQTYPSPRRLGPTYNSHSRLRARTPMVALQSRKMERSSNSIPNTRAHCLRRRKRHRLGWSLSSTPEDCTNMLRNMPFLPSEEGIVRVLSRSMTVFGKVKNVSLFKKSVGHGKYQSYNEDGFILLDTTQSDESSYIDLKSFVFIPEWQTTIQAKWENANPSCTYCKLHLDDTSAGRGTKKASRCYPFGPRKGI